MGDLEPLFGPAADVDVDVLLARLTAIRAGYLDQLDFNLQENLNVIDGNVDDILADTETIAWGDITAIDGLIDDIIADIGTFPTANYATLAAYVEDVRTQLIAIKAQTDILPAANADVSGQAIWVTLTHGNNEGDISALFSTDLTGSTRRRYAVFLDFTNVEADGAAWTKCTVRLKIATGAMGEYRTVDLKDIAKTDVAAAKEPLVSIDVPAVAKNVRITLQFDVALNADTPIIYIYVKEVLE